MLKYKTMFVFQKNEVESLLINFSLILILLIF